MFEANKSRFFEKLFSTYNRNLLKRRFHSLQVSGLDFLLTRNIRFPLIIYCNHSSWWDGLVAFLISREKGLDSFVLMEEKHLRKYPLFRRLGAFSVDREKPRKALESINYAGTLLREAENRTLWIFPQGEILPNDSRPIRFYSGLSKIIERIKSCSATSLSIRYEFLGEFKPQIFVKIENPEIYEVDENYRPKKMTDIFADRLTKNLDELKSDILNRNLADYKLLF